MQKIKRICGRRLAVLLAVIQVLTLLAVPVSAADDGTKENPFALTLGESKDIPSTAWAVSTDVSDGSQSEVYVSVTAAEESIYKLDVSASLLSGVTPGPGVDMYCGFSPADMVDVINNSSGADPNNGRMEGSMFVHLEQGSHSFRLQITNQTADLTKPVTVTCAKLGMAWSAEPTEFFFTTDNLANKPVYVSPNIRIGQEVTSVPPNRCTVDDSSQDKVTQENGIWLIKDADQLQVGDSVTVNVNITIMEQTQSGTFTLTVVDNSGPGGPGGNPTVSVPDGVTPIDVTNGPQTVTSADLSDVTENNQTWHGVYMSVTPTEDVLCNVYVTADAELYAQPDMGGIALCNTASAGTAEEINGYARNGIEYMYGRWYRLEANKTYTFRGTLPQSGLDMASVVAGAKMAPVDSWTLGESTVIPAVTEDEVVIQMPMIHVGDDTIPADQTAVDLTEVETSAGIPVTVEQVTRTQTFPDGTTGEVATNEWKLTGLKGQTSGTVTIKYTITFQGETRNGVYTVTIDENMSVGPGGSPESDGNVKIPSGVTPVDIQADTPMDIKPALQQMGPSTEMKVAYLRFTPKTTDIYTLGVIAPVTKADPMFNFIEVCEVAGVRQSGFFCDAHSDYRLCRSFKLEADKTYTFQVPVLADAADRANEVTATMSGGWKVYEQTWSGGMGGGSVMLESGGFQFPADAGSIRVVSFDNKIITAEIRPQSNDLRIVSLGEGTTDVVLEVTFLDETKQGKWIVTAGGPGRPGNPDQVTSIAASASIQQNGTVAATITGVYDPTVPVGDSVDMNRNQITFDATVSGPGTEQVTSSQAVITKVSTDSLVENNIQKATYKTNQANVTFDDKALAAMAAADSDISLAVAVTPQEGGSGTTVTLTLQTVGEHPVEIIPESTKDRNGTVTVSVPYAIAEGKAVNVYYIKEGQEAEPVPATYDSANRAVTFTTDHFSEYLIEETDSSCSHVYREEDYKSNGDATCQEDGTMTALCALCGKMTDTKPDTGSKTEHDYAGYKPYEEATCQKDATEQAVCSICHKQTDIRTVAGTKKAHSYQAYVSDHNATCTKDGTKTAVCAVCGQKDTVTDVGSKSAHNYQNGKCTVCGTAEFKTGCDGVHDCATAGYGDVDKGDWYHTQGWVDYVVARGVMTGTSEETPSFEPQTTVTRAQMVETLWKMEGKPAADGTEPFADVSDGDWYAKSVTWAYVNGLAKGITDTAFDPQGQLTREQMVTFLYRYATFKGADVTAGEISDQFSDREKVGDFARPAMAWAVEHGIISGMGTTPETIEPQGTASRAQLAKILTVYLRMSE